MIRAATVEDLDALMRLNAVVQVWHAQHYPKVFRPDPDPVLMRAFFEEMLGADDCHILISEDQSGYMFARLHLGKDTPYGRKLTELHVEHIAVQTDRQREGIGRKLMEATEDLARSLGCRALRLDTWAANTQAHSMFEAFGMAPLRHHYSKDLD
jgi:ribosomal protein S18 acetylase RimI-like enzyme